MVKLFIITCILLAVIQKSETRKRNAPCECNSFQCDQNKFCDADYAMIVKVTKQSGNKYSISVVGNPIKKPKKGTNLKEVVMSSSCPLDFVLKKKKCYYIAGHIVGKVLHLDKCTSVVIEEKLASATQKDNFKNGFIKSCNCKVDFKQYGDDAQPAKTPNNCLCVQDRNDAVCVNRNWICQKSGGECNWSDSKEGCPPIGFFPMSQARGKRSLKISQDSE